MASPSKKPLFNRPAWAKAETKSESTDFFRHSDAVYENLRRDEERRREKRAKRKARRKKEEEEEAAERERKRLKTSSPDQDEDLLQTGQERGVGRQSRSPSKRTLEPEKSQRSQEYKSHESDGPAAGSPGESYSFAPTETLGAEREASPGFEVLHSSPVKPKPRSLPSSSSSEEEEEDEFLRELKREAREKARLNPRKPQTQPTATTVNSPPSRPSTTDPTSQNADPATAPSVPAPTDTRPNVDDPLVQILVRSSMPDSKPLLVNRRASQTLLQVRQAWCARQPFPDAVKESIMLIWRGTRLFDTTTSRYLLDLLNQEEAKNHGGLFNLEDSESDSEGKPPGKEKAKVRIEVGAVTQQMYEAHLWARDRERTGNQGTENQDEAEEEAEHEEAQKEAGFSVNLKAAGFGQLTMRVKLNTPVAKIMDTFARAKKVPEGKTCWLVFDGERLEPEMTVGEVEMEQGDAVDVHVR